MKPTIRPAEPGDVAQLCDMIHALARHHGDVPTVRLQELHRDLFADRAWSRALVVEEPGQAELLGYALLIPKWQAQTARRGMDLHHLFVRPDHRGQGLGTRLVAAAEAAARVEGARVLSVGTHPMNDQAHAFYAHLGFRTESGTGPQFVNALVA